MRKLIFLWALLCVSLNGHAQTLKTVKQDLQKIIEQVDILIKAEKPEEPQGPKLDSCKRGPTPERIFNITQNGATVVFDGDGVFGWEYSVYQGAIKKAGGNTGDKNLESNTVPISFTLEPGDYTLKLQGKTCLSKVYSKGFTVPKPTSDNGNGGDGGNSGPPPATDKESIYRMTMGMTGDSFDPDAKHGIPDEWISRIEAVNFNWGYAISDIGVWIPWDKYEKKQGVYEEAALKRIIEYCRARNLSLSVVFLRRRSQNDGFINPNEYITGSNGTVYYEGCCGTGKVYAGYANERVNALSAGAIKSIARIMGTYEKSFYIALGGGGAGEQVNYVFNSQEYREVADHSEDNKQRFYNNWLPARGVSVGGTRPSIPMVQGAWNDWPYPNYNDTLGVEFGRFTTYGIKRAFDSFVDAVKSENTKLICTYLYSVTSNLQFRSIQNPNINWIAERADGLYGSDGDGIGDLEAKMKVNALNLGTFPNKVSMAEADIGDLTSEKNPKYCIGGIQVATFEKLVRDLYDRGVMDFNLAMAFCEDELRSMEPAFRNLRRDYVGKPYKWPSVNASNTKVVNVLKYRNSEDLMQGINPRQYYVKYTDEGFWGGVSPEVGDGGGPAPRPSADFSPVKSYVEANLANAYNWNAVFSLRSPSGELYSFEKGGKTKDTRFKVMSHSKFTTGVIIAYLIDQGKLSLDTKVAEIIKSLKGAAIGEVTIRQIMGHLSGIPDDQSNEGAKTLEEHVNWIAGLGLEFTPGSRFKYSTVSYQVVARMAEIVTGKKWKDLFKEILVDPCEMGQAEYNPVGTGDVKGNPNNPLAGYGLICSGNEWMNFIGMIRDKGMFKGRRVLNERVFDILKTQTSPGWSDWGVGVMIKDGKYVSEAASGCGTTILEDEYAWTIFTDSSYDKAYWQNIEVRNIVDQIYKR